MKALILIEDNPRGTVPMTVMHSGEKRRGNPTPCELLSRQVEKFISFQTGDDDRKKGERG